MKPYEISADIAKQIYDWIMNREGVQIWENLDLGSNGAERMTPVRNPDGSLNDRKPHWSCGAVKRVLAKLEDVEVYISKEVKRFRVGLQRGSGFRIELTDAATAKVRRMCDAYRPYHCNKCGWKGFDRDLKTRKAKSASYSYGACPECNDGEQLDSLKEAWYSFDYERQEAVILIEDGMMPLAKFMEEAAKREAA